VLVNIMREKVFFYFSQKVKGYLGDFENNERCRRKVRRCRKKPKRMCL